MNKEVISYFGHTTGFIVLARERCKGNQKRHWKRYWSKNRNRASLKLQDIKCDTRYNAVSMIDIELDTILQFARLKNGRWRQISQPNKSPAYWVESLHALIKSGFIVTGQISKNMPSKDFWFVDPEQAEIKMEDLKNSGQFNKVTLFCIDEYVWIEQRLIIKNGKSYWKEQCFIQD